MILEYNRRLSLYQNFQAFYISNRKNRLYKAIDIDFKDDILELKNSGYKIPEKGIVYSQESEIFDREILDYLTVGNYVYVILEDQESYGAIITSLPDSKSELYKGIINRENKGYPYHISYLRWCNNVTQCRNEDIVTFKKENICQIVVNDFYPNENLKDHIKVVRPAQKLHKL